MYILVDFRFQDFLEYGVNHIIMFVEHVINFVFVGLFAVYFCITNHLLICRY